MVMCLYFPFQIIIAKFVMYYSQYIIFICLFIFSTSFFIIEL